MPDRDSVAKRVEIGKASLKDWMFSKNISGPDIG